MHYNQLQKNINVAIKMSNTKLEIKANTRRQYTGIIQRLYLV